MALSRILPSYPLVLGLTGFKKKKRKEEKKNSSKVSVRDKSTKKALLLEQSNFTMSVIKIQRAETNRVMFYHFKIIKPIFTDAYKSLTLRQENSLKFSVRTFIVCFLL